MAVWELKGMFLGVDISGIPPMSRNALILNLPESEDHSLAQHKFLQWSQSLPSPGISRQA
jgi:hypothetical protein